MKELNTTESPPQAAVADKFYNADLHGAELQGADLHDVNFRWADLQGADLRGADLRWANFREAKLYEADLRGANLRWANLHGADLRGADLRGADLRETELRWANLRGANIIILQLEQYTAYIQPDDTRIGCHHHPSDNWLKWSPDSVAHMANDAKAWWEKYQDVVKAAIRSLK